MNFDKESYSDFFLLLLLGGGGGGGGAETKTVCQTVSNDVKYKKCNYLQNVEHVVQSTFQNMLITFKHKPYSKCL